MEMNTMFVTDGFSDEFRSNMSVHISLYVSYADIVHFPLIHIIYLHFWFSILFSTPRIPNYSIYCVQCRTILPKFIPNIYTIYEL